MRIARFSYQNVPRYAFVQYDDSDNRDYLVALDGHPLVGGRVKPTGERFSLEQQEVRLLAPVIPSKIYGLAKNYRNNIDTSSHDLNANNVSDTMIVFTKPSTAVVGPNDALVIPSCSQSMNFEPEVAVVIGRVAKNVTVEAAMDHVLGFTCVNDVTLCDVMDTDPFWTRVKGFDTSCPLGPWIETELAWQDARISFTLNGVTVPQACGTTANLIHSIPEQISYISSFATLLPGDVILTGTPCASELLHDGDEAIVHVQGIGSLRNVVVQASLHD